MPAPVHYDCVFLPDLVRDIENKLNITFSLDGACAPSGHQSPVPHNFCSKHQSCLHTSAAGHTLWLNAPSKHIFSFFMHYNKCKLKAPHTTCACFLVPVWDDPPPVWLHLFADMQLIQEFPIGAEVYARSDGRRVQTNCKLRVYYDPVILPPPPPRPMLSCVGRLLTSLAPIELESVLPDPHLPSMIFPLSSNKLAGTVLADSGASDSFARVSYIKAAGIPITPCPDVRIHLADKDSVLHVIGITLHRKVTMVIPVFVLPDLVHGVDLILGESWLKSHSVQLDYRTNKCIIHKPKGKIKLRPSKSVILTPKSSWTAALSSATAPVVTAKQAIRLLRRGAQPMFVLVRESITATGDRSTEADPHHTTSCAGCSVSAAQSPEATLNLNSNCTSTTFRENFKVDGLKEGDAFPMSVNDDAHTVLPKPSYPNITHSSLIPEPALQALLDEYTDVLSSPPADREIGHFAIGHTIPLVPGAAPPFRRAHRLNPKEESAARDHVKEMILKKYITPSKSPYGAPILFIAKPDGGLRVVCDYRMLNKLTIKNRYPLPRIDELLAHIGGKIIFSSLDLLDGYYQIAITAEDQQPRLNE